MSTDLLLQILVPLASAILGYFLRHWGINIPGLPSAPAAPATSPAGGILPALEGAAVQLAEPAVEAALAKLRPKLSAVLGADAEKAAEAEIAALVNKLTGPKMPLPPA